MNKPSAQIAIEILSTLKNQTNSAAIAYWVTPNTILTLSGARAYCDGVFYHNDKKTLDFWTEEVGESIKILESITGVYFAEAKFDKSTSKESCVTYDIVLTQGLENVLNSTTFLNDTAVELLKQKLNGEQLIKAICSLLEQDERFKHFDKENLKHIAFGVLVGYPDSAILGSVTKWGENDPFDEPLIDADIRGSWYYICPKPVYSYPQHLVTDSVINTHERLWSTILKDYYESDFHKQLEADKKFQQRLDQLGMLR